ncbi:MAG: ATP-binding protein [Anaerolineales bacterium]|nr:ATP-binding protein [Anaerolineales bacterium]
MSGGVQSLTDLISKAGAKRILDAPPAEDMGLAEHLPFPFLAIVGQPEMKLALLLSLINPTIGGALLVGPRGTAKTTAVRSLTDLLPDVHRSRCNYGCLPEDIEAGGIDAVCPECAQRFAQGEPLTYTDRVRLIELPLNARLEDVIGGIDERAAVHQRLRVERGILARADQNILYIDEVNLLDDEIADAILDAAAQGTYSVHRGPLAATYRARFVLIGSMNPEEGNLRPQILDRFGLRVIVRGLRDQNDRLEAYKRSIAHRRNPREFIRLHQEAMEIMRVELQAAREQIHSVEIAEQAERFGQNLIQELGIHSLRSEITLFEAARAHAIADGRHRAEIEDIESTARMSLRLRRSPFIDQYLDQQVKEDQEIAGLVEKFHSKPSSKGRNVASAPRRSTSKKSKPGK